ncbi:DUF6153 family protein [Rhodococcus sp. NPDC003994]|jgi:hypothetical protein|uniref:DUF6153 family protein n=1 Tax=Rhodococcoides kroppenstedtii TaxID=293050 RepID=UPI0028EAA164|nr:DUF6153 family protein [Rhodococcus kroppenstedtii]
MTATGRRLRGTIPLAVLTVLTVLGVLSMHSVPMFPSASHQAMAAATASTVVTGSDHHGGEAHDPVVSSSVVVEPTPCPGGHPMTHPCMATPVSWSAISMPSGVVTALPASDPLSTRMSAVMGRSGRAPPWAVSALDESVLLRV